MPTCFNRFTGYNKPELKKHRKRTRENMDSTPLCLCGDALFGCLQGVYWHKCGWKNFWADIELLATSLSKYSEYLDRQCVATKQVHFSPHPVWQPSFTCLPKFLHFIWKYLVMISHTVCALLRRSKRISQCFILVQCERLCFPSLVVTPSIKPAILCALYRELTSWWSWDRWAS